MAVFVDLEDEDIEPPQNGQPPRWHGSGNGIDDAVKAAAKAAAVAVSSSADHHGTRGNGAHSGSEEEGQRLVVRENPNRNSMTQALGCYP